LAKEFAAMIGKIQWVFLPWSYASTLDGLRLSPVGVVPYFNLLPTTCSMKINSETFLDVPHDAIQFGQALQCYIQVIISANPTYGPI
jgi:hypothetical protein